MFWYWKRVVRVSAIGAICSLGYCPYVTRAEEAQRESSILINQADPGAATQAGPALPPPANATDGPTSAPTANPNPRQTTEQSLPIPPQSAGRAARRPFMRPAVPREPAQGRLVGELPAPNEEASPAIDEPIVALPAPSQGAAEDILVKPAPPIEYDTDHDARKMYRKSGTIDVVMVTTNPADGCAYEIPMCIPACCEGEPKVNGGRGIFGRGVVEYRWACGFRAIVKFRHVLGDVKVDYDGLR